MRENKGGTTMANIIAKIAQIRAAVLGIDVRENIASGIEGINTEVVSTTARQTVVEGKEAVLEGQFNSLVINAGSSNAEIVAGRTSSVTAETFDTIGHRADGVDAQLADNATHLKTNTNLADFFAQTENISVSISSIIDITENLTIPSNFTLTFVHGGKLNILSGVTLTLNCAIDAGYKEIFTYENDTAIITTTQLSQLNHQTVIHNTIKMDWFGASPNAKTPPAHICDGSSESLALINALPTGIDSTKAIKRAVAFCNAGSTNQGLLLSYPFLTLEGTPNGCYVVKGDNILGNQSTRNCGFIFKGNMCSFFWVPLTPIDSFINNFAYYERPVQENYFVHLFGFTGSYGIFCNTGITTGWVPLSQPHFKNITVRGGTTVDNNISVGLDNTIDTIFKIDGEGNCDQFYLERCLFYHFDKMVDNTNLGSVSFVAFKSMFYSQKTNAVFFKYSGAYAGGFSLQNCDVLMKGINQTLFQTIKTEGISIVNGEFHVDNTRLETSPNQFTLVDAEFGKFYINGINVLYGGGAMNALSTATKLKHPAVVIFKDCYLPKIFYMEVMNYTDYTALGGNAQKCLTLDNCDFGDNFPIYTFLLAGVEKTYRQALEGNLCFRPFEVKNSIRFNCSYYSAMAREDMQIFNSVSLVNFKSGYSYAGGSITLPPHCIVTSLKLRVGSAAAIIANKIKVKIGTFEIDTNLLTSAGQSIELITIDSVGVVVPVANYLETHFYLNAALADDFTTTSYLIATYRGIIGRGDLTTTDVVKIVQ